MEPARVDVRERERRDPEATRRALLQAGAGLFAERGFDGVPIEAVAERAGVNKALISYHFRGKRGLYVAILESTFAEVRARLSAVDGEAESAGDALRLFLDAIERFWRERPGFPTLFMREVLAQGIEPAVVPHLLAIIGVTRRLAERGAREGLFRKVDPLLFHFGLVGSVIFFLATEPARRKAAASTGAPFALPEARAFLRYVEELTLRGLAPGGEAARPPAKPYRPRRKGARA